MIKRIAVAAAIMLALAGLTATTPAQADTWDVGMKPAAVSLLTVPAPFGRSACPATYVCAWNNSGWTGTMAAYQPSYVYGAPNHCLDFDQTSSNDAISSIASYNSAATVYYFRDIHCTGPYLGINPSQQIKNLQDWNMSAGGNANDKFTSIYDPTCC